MLLSILSLATVAASSPLMNRQVGNYPALSKSSAFTLIANITSPRKLSQERFAEFQHWSITGVHVGAGLNAPTLSDDPAYSVVFWQNDTTVDGRERANYQTFTDSTPIPFGFWRSPGDVDPDNNPHTVGISWQRGDGTKGFFISDVLSGVPELYPALPKETEGTFAVCVSFTAPMRPGLTFDVIESTVHQEGIDYSDRLAWFTPENCAQVALIQQCAEMPPLPEGVVYTRDYVMEVSCYEDVASIDWTKYDAPKW